MTRKDYVMIADTIRETLNYYSSDDAREGLSDRSRTLLNGKRIAVRCLAHRLGDQLRQDNPRFEMSRFIEDCGLSS